MTDVLEPVSTLDDDLALLAEPLRVRIAKVDAELATAEAMVRMLREDRKKIRDALRYVDPAWEDPRPSKYGPKPKKQNQNGAGSHASKKVITDAKVQVIHDWIMSIRDDLPTRGITGTQLSRRPDAPAKQEHIAYALRLMHDRGAIRLDHTGTGGSKFYVVV
jgi:hypothetical protein